MHLSIIVPCFNEDQTILPLLHELYSVDFGLEFECIIVDDGSTVPTFSIIKPFLDKHPNCRLYQHPRNLGKGCAIRTGFKHAKGDYILIQDADMEYSPSDIPKLLAPVRKFGVKVVYGSRFLDGNRDYNKAHLSANIFLTKFTNWILKTRLTDMETGYKLISREVFSKFSLKGQSFEIEPEMTLQIVSNGYNIIEVPISYNHRIKGQAKINPTDGIEALLFLIVNKYFKNCMVAQALYRIYKFRIKTPLAKLIRRFLYPILYKDVKKNRVL